MRHGKHTSTKMQQRWNEYPESFAYTVLLVCEPDQILQREQDLVDRFQPELNTAPYSYSNAAMKMTAAQREAMKHRPQSIAKKHPLRGEMLTVPQIAERVGVSVPCIRARMREGRDLGSPSQKGVPVPMEIDGEWLTPRQIADRFALPLTTVYSRLSRGWTGERLTEPRKHRGRFSL